MSVGPASFLLGRWCEIHRAGARLTRQSAPRPAADARPPCSPGSDRPGRSLASSISPLGNRTSGTPCTSRLAYLDRLQAMSQPPIIGRSVTARGCPAVRPPTRCDTSNSGRPWRRATPPSFPTRSVCPAGSRMDRAVPNRCLVRGLFGAITTRQACSVPHTVQLGGSHQPIQWVWKPERTRGLRAAPTVA